MSKIKLILHRAPWRQRKMLFRSVEDRNTAGKILGYCFEEYDKVPEIVIDSMVLPTILSTLHELNALELCEAIAMFVGYHQSPTEYAAHSIMIHNQISRKTIRENKFHIVEFDYTNITNCQAELRNSAERVFAGGRTNSVLLMNLDEEDITKYVIAADQYPLSVVTEPREFTMDYFTCIPEPYRQYFRLVDAFDFPLTNGVDS